MYHIFAAWISTLRISALAPASANMPDLRMSMEKIRVIMPAFRRVYSTAVLL